MNIFSRRLVFVVGKGGSGKTTFAIAIGLAAERMGKKVLIVETGDADAAGHVFGKGTLQHTPEKVSSGIWGARIHPKSVLEEYIHVHIGFRFISNAITRASLFEHLADATPGLKDVMTLGQIWRFEKKTDEYDLVVVDAPATGHGLSLLRQPGTLADMLRFGPIANQTKAVQNLLGNREKTGIALVTLPEELPVNEAVEFIKQADTELQMPVNMTIINKVYEDMFNDDESEAVMKSFGESSQVLLEPAKKQILRRRVQQAHMDRIRGVSPGKVVEIPFRFTNELTLDEIGAIGELLVSKAGGELA